MTGATRAALQRQGWPALSVALGGVLGCAPDFEDRPYLIEQLRLLAVAVQPAEARPRQTVSVFPIVAGAAALPLSFHFCAQTRQPADPRSLAASCLDDPGVALEPSNDNPSARGMIPADACSRFGPDPSNNAVRPADADATGGFYQPLVVLGAGTPSVAFVRVHCPLPDAPAELSRELEARYTLNENPQLLQLEADRGAGAGFETDFTLTAAAPTSLRVSWPASARENYVWLPPDGDAIAPRSEALRASWFTTGATLATSATGGTEGDSSTFSVNTITPDAGVGSVDVWVVLQDSRGGTTAKHWRRRVVP